jgi:RNA polymerase sigma-70 factor (ECF subfamily)
MIDLWRSSRSRFQTDLLNKDFDEDSEENNWNDFDQLASDEPLPQELFEKNENANLVLDLLNRLKREEREILILRFLDELEYKELSRIYKTTEDNVRQKVSRALQNLKKVAKKNS